MASLNKVMLIGNTGREAELRYLASGTAKSEFSLAVNYRRRAASGEWEEATEWFNIVIFGEQAERVSQFISKGKQIYVEGRLQTRTWDDDQGQKHYRTEVIASNIVLLGGRDGQGGGGGGWDDGESAGGGGFARGGARQGGGARAGAPARPAGGTRYEDPDDLPFE